jgi:hypothetical protein
MEDLIRESSALHLLILLYISGNVRRMEDGGCNTEILRWYITNITLYRAKVRRMEDGGCNVKILRTSFTNMTL